uniref:Uncharacterized protein n=1 Tax=Knipowitschia caucasica TaxID=637954 RepID=A0AAV2KAI3_KNICA
MFSPDSGTSGDQSLCSSESSWRPVPVSSESAGGQSCAPQSPAGAVPVLLSPFPSRRLSPCGLPQESQQEDLSLCSSVPAGGPVPVLLSPSRRPVPVLLRVPAGGQSLCSSVPAGGPVPCSSESQAGRPSGAPQVLAGGPVPVLLRVPAGGQSLCSSVPAGGPVLCSSSSSREASPCAHQCSSRRPSPCAPQFSRRQSLCSSESQAGGPVPVLLES